MIREMEYITTIWEEKSFTRAAKKLQISQPALSATVRKVEDQLGIALFDRSKKPFGLTLAGEYYMNSAKQILNIYAGMEQYFSNLTQLKIGKVTIGASPFFCCYVLPGLIKKFQKQYPNIEIFLIEGTVTNLNEQLINESIDILVCTSFEINKETMAYDVWGREHLLLSVPRSFAINYKLAHIALHTGDIIHKRYLEPDCPKASMHQFKGETILTLPKGNDLYKRTLSICKDSGFSPALSCSPAQELTAYFMSKAEMGITFVRDQLLLQLPLTDDICFYLIDSPLTQREIYLATKKNRQIPIDISEFYQFLLSEIY